jgi:tetratricopeptide (TPR) repeat protein
VTRWWWPILLLVAGCSSAASDHERLGDVAYGQLHYGGAAAEYRAALKRASDGRLLAKLALAAMHDQSYREAGDAYRRLAAQDPSRKDEAANGLELVARAAERARDDVALRQAVTALRTIAPARLSGRYALGLVQEGKLDPNETLVIIPAALAAASDAGAVDSLLTVYGKAFQQNTACDAAAKAYRAVLRRSHDTKVRQRAGAGLAQCALQLGQEALTVQKPEQAALWFGEAISQDTSSAIGRRALVGLGDARVAEGDLLGAAIAYQRAIAPEGTTNDSTSQTARERLNRLGAAPDAPTPSPSRTP